MKYLPLLFLTACHFSIGCSTTSQSWLVKQQDGAQTQCWAVYNQDIHRFGDRVFWEDSHGESFEVSGKVDYVRLNPKDPYQAAQYLNVDFDSCKSR